MADPLEETISLSELTELLITETEGQWGTNGERNMVAHYEVPIHRDRLLVARRGAGGGAAQPEGSKPDSRLQSPEIRRCVRRRQHSRRSWMRYGQARPREHGAFDSGRY